MNICEMVSYDALMANKRITQPYFGPQGTVEGRNSYAPEAYNPLNQRDSPGQYRSLRSNNNPLTEQDRLANYMNINSMKYTPKNK